jgi:membrane-bound lytic murein transglycosylase A
MDPQLTPSTFSELEGWNSDMLLPALVAFRRSAMRAKEKPYRTGSLGLAHVDFAASYEAAISLGEADEAMARTFFETAFKPFRIHPPAPQHGFVTGFYEPVVDAAARPDARFRFPLLRRPPDLVDLDDANRPTALDPDLRFGRQTEAGIVEYHDRAAIEGGALKGQGLELAWLDDPVDLFFIHVQGAARLVMRDGSLKRVTYAAKSGQRFTGPGSVLVHLGELGRTSVSMQSIRAWFRANPQRINEILHQNRSFIFFREAPVWEPDLGPIAAAKVPLAPGRSIAVDRLIHTFGTPLFVTAPELTTVNDAPFARLMIAQDTGSAIVGAARGDLFIGSGDQAGEIAGVIKHPAAFTILVPTQAAGRFAS